MLSFLQRLNMQIEFLTAKESFIELYVWISDNIGDVVILFRKIISDNQINHTR